METTEDIINAIIAVFNKNYKDHDLSFLQESLSNNKNMSYYYSNENEDDEENEESDENEEEESDSGDKEDENEKIKKKNDELLDLCLSSSLSPSISAEDLNLI